MPETGGGMIAPGLMDRDWAQALSDFADQAVLLPLALLVMVALLRRGRRVEARGWAQAVGAVLLGLLLLKLGVGACATPALEGGSGLFGLGLRSPSGHSAAGGMIYGGVLALRLRRGPWESALVTLAVASVFAASRLTLGVHTVADVVVGCAVSAAGGALLAWRSGWPRHGIAESDQGQRESVWPWSAAALVLMLSLHGRRLGAEPLIVHAARAWFSPACNW